MNNNIIHIVITCSDLYVPNAMVTMSSILCNLSPEYNVKFHMFTFDIGEESKRNINFLKEIRDFEINYIYIENRNILPLPKQTRVNNIAYARLLVGELLDDTVKKCIVIDADLVFDYDISELWNIDLEDKCVGLAKDPLDRNDTIHQHWANKYEIPEDYYYTNSGVILIDLEKWRKLEIQKQIFLNLEKYDEILNFYDQDVIFITLCSFTKYIDDRWNYLPNIYYTDEQLKNELSGTAYVYHFGGPKKPWIDPSAILSYKWWKYARKSPSYEQVLYQQIDPKVEVNRLRNEFKNRHFPNINNRFTNDEYNSKLLYIICHKFKYRIRKIEYKLKMLLAPVEKKEVYKEKYKNLKKLIKDAKDLRNSFHRL